MEGEWYYYVKTTFCSSLEGFSAEDKVLPVGEFSQNNLARKLIVYASDTGKVPYLICYKTGFSTL